MSTKPAKAVALTVATVRQRMPWLMLALGMLMVLALLGHAAAPPVAASLTHAMDQVQASPDRGHPGDLPDLVAIAESSAETLRSARPRPADTPPTPMTAPVAAPAGMFVAAATDTLLRHAVERTHRYPPAPYLLLNPGHAPPRA